MALSHFRRPERFSPMSQRFYTSAWNGVSDNESYVDVTAWAGVVPDGAKNVTSAVSLGKEETLKFKAGTKGRVVFALDIAYQRPDVWHFPVGDPEPGRPGVSSVLPHPYHKGNLKFDRDLSYTCTEEGELTVDLPTAVKKEAGTDIALKILFQKVKQKSQMLIHAGFDAPLEKPYWLEVLARDEKSYDPNL